MLAIIGDTGLTRLSSLDVSRRQVVRTPYGEPSGPLTFGAIRGVPEVFLAREIELGYAAIAVVVNHAAGRGASARGIPLDKIEAVLKDAVARVCKVIEAVAVAP